MNIPRQTVLESDAIRSLAMLFVRLTLFTFIWWLLVEGRQDSWYAGVPLVLLATALSHALAQPSRRSPMGLLRFLPYFIMHSLRGATDVAWRALHPARPIDPVLIDYPLRLPNEEARVFFSNALSLLPGTLSARLEGNRLQVHILDYKPDCIAELKELEAHVAAIFLITLEAKDGDD